MSQAPNRNFPRTSGDETPFTKADGSARLDEIFDGIHSDHSGTTAPASPSLGLTWLDTSSTPYLRKQYDGAQWTVTHILDPAAGAVLLRIADGTTTLPALHYASDTGAGLRLHTAGHQRAVFGGADVLVLEAANNTQALAGTDVLRPVTSAGLASFKQLSTQGYFKFPGGLLMQWGSPVQTLSSGGQTTIDFPTNFTSAVFTIVTCNGDMGVAATESASFGVLNSSVGLSSFVLEVRPNPGAVQIRANYTAFGR